MPDNPNKKFLKHQNSLGKQKNKNKRGNVSNEWHGHMFSWYEDQENWPLIKAVRLGVRVKDDTTKWFKKEYRTKKSFIILPKPKRPNNYKWRQKL